MLRYSYDMHVITKLEDHEGKEITPEGVVEQYYKDPNRYFEVVKDIRSKTQLPEGGVTAATAVLAPTLSRLE